jgi:hypothetical protein
MEQAGLDAGHIRTLVARELALVRDVERRAALEALLVEPRMEERDWDYGLPGERYPVWVVAEKPDEAALLVYCEHGFGPGMPWGFLTDHPTFASLGMDSQWGWYLEEAFVRSGLAKGPARPRERFDFPPEMRFRKRKGDGSTPNRRMEREESG